MALYPNQELHKAQLDYNVNEIKKFNSDTDCIVSYFNYFEQWTPILNNEERKVLLNRLLQDDDIAFSIYMDNANESYEMIKHRLIRQFTESGESLLKNKKDKRKRRKMFRRMSKEEMANYIRTTYNELNSLSKERLVIKELTRILPRNYKKLDLEDKCSTIDQVIEALSEKFDNMKLKHDKDGKKKLKKLHRRHRNGSSSSSSSSESSDEKHKKKGHHFEKHGKEHKKELGF